MKTFQRRKLRWSLALVMVAAIALVSGFSSAEPDRQKTGELTVSGPYRHENLSVFLVHGESRIEAADLLTLDEALEQRKVVVRETGDVNQLVVENVSNMDVFILAGDIVKGGRQDRVLSTDLLLPPKSGPTPIDSFCVEQGRWSRRGAEASDRFESSEHALASRKLKLAARSSKDQGQVWREVAEVQGELAKVVAMPVRAAESESSLQLTLEHPEVEAKSSGYVDALAGIVDRHGDAVGYALSVNGRLSSVDIFAGHALFAKVWPKLLRANAVEAVSESGRKIEVEATIADVEDALETIAIEAEDTRSLTDRVQLVRKENAAYVSFATVDRRDELELRLNLLRKDG